jgi:hypothetical protein
VENQEELLALSQDDENGPIYAVMYSNDLGLFQRRNGIWLQLPSDHDEFDDLFATSIDLERGDDFIAAYDKGNMTVPEADTFQVGMGEAVVAAGGLDKNRGNAETLRRYWTTGEGAAKIRWGTPGDWSRCVRHLSKYLGPRAKGYCQLRHKDALGIYTATHAKKDRSKNFTDMDETTFTYVTDIDMSKTIGQIHAEADDIFDGTWEPDVDIIIILGDSLEDDAILAAVEAPESCPPATQDITINLTNRENAIKTAGYGPLNPGRPNTDFWQKKADRWSTDVEEAKSSRCGNCAVFIKTPRMLDCISEGLGNEEGNDAWGAIDAGELGYCEAFDFKCAASRTCDAWVAGGPVTEEKPSE